MPFGPDQRPDSSGVPAELAPGRPEAGHSPPSLASPTMHAKVRFAVRVCIAKAILSVAGFLAYALPRLFGPVENPPVNASPVQALLEWAEHANRQERPHALERGGARC